jgi:hypothetical protein
MRRAGHLARLEEERKIRILVGNTASVVVRVPGYRSRGPGSIPDATRFSEK